MLFLMITLSLFVVNCLYYLAMYCNRKNDMFLFDGYMEVYVARDFRIGRVVGL